MTPELIITADGSHTLYVKELNEHYHSTFGAIQESQHIFMESGFNFIKNNITEINILEVGFGTGLNALLTLINSAKNKITVNYTAMEAFPLKKEIYEKLNYVSLLRSAEAYANYNYEEMFLNLHTLDWNTSINFNDLFKFKKIQALIQDYQTDATFDLIYFDAFAPDIQPELWTENVFCILYKSLNFGGVLITYSCKGSVRRALKSAGFIVTKIPGPAGKREITRAMKI